MRIRLAAAFAVILFFVLAGVGVSAAYWSTRDTATGNVEAVSLSANCQPASRLTNGSFEVKDMGTAQSITQAPPTDMAPWTTTDTTIEVWSNGVGGVTPQVGTQFVELNANDFGTLYQDVTTTPGQTIRWSLLHRGRAGSDTMRVELGNAATGVMVSQGTQTDGTSGWGRHEGVYTVPPGQTKTRFAMVAVSTASGNISVGNFIDDVSFGSGPCLKVATTVANQTNTLATTRPGDTLRYTATVTNSGGSLALASALATTLPAGITYVPGSMVVQGTAQSDSAGNDRAEVSGSTLTARMGLNATATVGGSVAPDDSLTFVFDAVVQPSAGGNSVVLDVAGTYADALAPNWTQSTTANTLTTPVANGADMSIANLATPTVVAGSGTSVWSFQAKNLGTLAAAGTSAIVTLPASMSGATVIATTNAAGTATTTCASTNGGLTRTCAIGAVPLNETRNVTVSYSVPAATPDGTQLSVKAAVSTTTYDPASSNNSATNSATVTGDTTAPTAPVLSATSTTATAVALSWTAATDNVGGSGVAGYEIFRDGVSIGTTTGNTTRVYTDSTVKSGTTYAYTVKTLDAAGNKSVFSNTITRTTLPGTASYQVSYTQGTTTLCLTADSTANNAPLRLQTCATPTSALQTWRFTVGANTTVDGVTVPSYSVVLASSTTRSWDLGTNSAANSLPIRVTTIADNYDKWAMVKQAGLEEYSFVNAGAKTCMDVNGQVATTNKQLQSYECNDTIAQNFTMKNLTQ